jgi:sec-independent protein translocase protein TatA
MAGIGAPELLVVLVILLLIFGSSKLPKLARSIGQAGREFKEGVKEGAGAPTEVEGPCPFCGVQVPDESKFCPGCAKPAVEIIAERAKEQKSPA